MALASRVCASERECGKSVRQIERVWERVWQRESASAEECVAERARVSECGRELSTLNSKLNNVEGLKSAVQFGV